MLTEQEKKKRNYARTKRWRRANPGVRKEESRRYRAKHPEKTAQFCRTWRSKPQNREKAKQYMRDYQVKNREKRRSEKLKHRYGMTISDYESMLSAQDGKCAICKQEQPRALHVDHSHTTNAVRGLLCNGCNGLLGFSCENPSILRAAAEYIERHNGGQND